MCSSRSRILPHCVCLAVGCLISLGPAARAAEPRQWAVLIGVQEHDERRFNLKFTENDVQRLRQTLVERAGLSSDYILQMTDGTADRRPTLANLKRELPAFLAKPAENDRVLVFFSGHGFLHNSKTYLVPRDFSLRDPAGSALPLAEVRKALNDCKARVKFLILDCCHAGNDKAIDDTLPSSAVAKAIEAGKSVRNCVVLASCNEDEKSMEWGQRKQGVFTYWLCRGLEGAAADDNGRVTIAKLNSYVQERVSQTVEQEFNGQQNPQRFGKVTGEPVVLMLQPEQPETLCRRLAEHLDMEVRRHKLKKVGVLEFLQQPLGGTERLVSAIQPAYCAEQVRQALTKLGAGSYEVLNAAAMQQASKGVGVEVIGQPQAMRRLGQQAGGADAVVIGTLRRRGPRMLVQCELVSTANGDSLVKPSGVLPLSETTPGDQGGSYYLRDRPAGKPHDTQVINYVEEEARTGHPLLDPSFPFHIELRTVAARPGEAITDATPRKKKELVQLRVEGSGGKKRTELLVAARDGETFEIHVANKSKRRIGMVLMVDGLNTLGQERARIGHARKWVLEAGKEYDVTGWTFLERKDRDGKSETRRFMFVNLAKSVAGRQNFGESIGLITVAIYKEDTDSRSASLGVGEGVVEMRKLKTVKFVAGQLLGVVNVRYVDERELNK
ncbi:MAG TPA: caspase family protein [Gemmataceae bacterium]|nr:caspase family protein [Gemmataceae bacterium]